MQRVAIYIRVSTEDQAKEGYSIPAQRERLNAFCISQGWTIVDEYLEEGKSAKDLDRPQLKRLMNDIEKGKFDLVLVFRLDRLTRSVLDLYTLLQHFDKHGIAFRSATEVYDTTTAIGRLFITLVAALAQWERENLAERTKWGMDQMVSEGARPGGMAPYGYKTVNENLVIDKPKAKVVNQIFMWYSQGKGMPTILKTLHNKIIKSPTGNDQWNIETIRYMLSNPTYTGKIRWEGKGIIDGGHEPIIDIELWEKVQTRREENRMSSPSEIKGRYPFSGTLICGHCGSKMSGKMFKRSGGGHVVYYRCSKKIKTHDCEARYIRQDELEEELINWLDEVFNDLSELKRILSEEEEEPVEDIRAELEQELERISKQKNRWYSLFNDPNNPIPANDLFKQIRPLTEREEVIHTQLSSIKGSEYSEPTILDRFEQYKDFKLKWSQNSTEERKQMIKDVFQYIKIFNDYTHKYKFR